MDSVTTENNLKELDYEKWEGIISDIGYEVECVETYGKHIKREENLLRKDKLIDRARGEAKKSKDSSAYYGERAMCLQM